MNRKFANVAITNVAITNVTLSLLLHVIIILFAGYRRNHSMALLLYLTVVSWTVIASLGTQCQQNSAVNQMRKGRPHQFYPSPISDHVLRGKVYRTITTRSHATCAVLCLQEDVCRSFNFCQYERRCELNSAVYTKDKSDLYPSNGCLYFDEEYHRGKLKGRLIPTKTIYKHAG